MTPPTGGVTLQQPLQSEYLYNNRRMDIRGEEALVSGIGGICVKRPQLLSNGYAVCVRVVWNVGVWVMAFNSPYICIFLNLNSPRNQGKSLGNPFYTKYAMG